jgi:hypothetical protein
MVAAVAVIGVLGGCTSVKMVQRDGCWVRRTEKRVLGTVSEEVGPCARPTTAFVENDPLTRMVQECISRADYRWQARALAAWDRREPWPQQLSESSVLQQCMDDAARGVLGEAATLKEKNAALEERLAFLTREHEALKQKSEEERKELVRRSDEERKELFRRGDLERKELLALQSKLGEHLGAAAKKVQPLPAPNPAIATATATSEGRSRTEQGPAQPAGAITATATMVPPGGTAPVACVVPPDASTARADAKKKVSPSRQARIPRRETPKPAAAAANLPACDPTKTPADVKGTAADVKPAEAKGTTAGKAADGASVKPATQAATVAPPAARSPVSVGP